MTTVSSLRRLLMHAALFRRRTCACVHNAMLQWRPTSCPHVSMQVIICSSNVIYLLSIYQAGNARGRGDSVQGNIVLVITSILLTFGSFAIHAVGAKTISQATAAAMVRVQPIVQPIATVSKSVHQAISRLSLTRALSALLSLSCSLPV